MTRGGTNNFTNFHQNQLTTVSI